MPRAIGIDLGTTNSAMAVMTGGEPEIIENADGRRITPSVVGFNPKTGERMIGAAARRQAVTNPDNTIFSAKRFIGRRFDDDKVQEDRDLVPFKLEPQTNGDVGIAFDGQVRPPAEISAMVLRKLKEDAEAKLGERVTQAVITVPAYFNDAQREATQVAGRIAGLEVLRIVNEPAAAALAYGLDKTGDHTIAIYDLGGGTFDITILRIVDGVFEVLSTNGDTHLGGDDFDLRIVDWLVDVFQEREMIDLRQSSDRSPMQRLREEAERVKIELSSQTTSDINLPFLTADQTGPKHLAETLTRAKLEQMVGDLIDRTIQPCKQALWDAGLTATDIDEVLLVGGGTRMPAIRQRLSEFFGRHPNCAINPAEAVALGAAIQAGILERENKDSRGLDVTALSLGIEAPGGGVNVLIPRNSTIPATASRTITSTEDAQTRIEFTIVQGERPIARDNILVGRFVLDGIAPAPSGIPLIDVKFNINADGIMTVTAADRATTCELNITMPVRSDFSQEEINRIIAEANEHAESDRAQSATTKLKRECASLVDQARDTLNNRETAISPSLRTVLADQAEVVELRLNSASLDVKGLRLAMDDLRKVFSVLN